MTDQGTPNKPPASPAQPQPQQQPKPQPAAPVTPAKPTVPPGTPSTAAPRPPAAPGQQPPATAPQQPRPVAPAGQPPAGAPQPARPPAQQQPPAAAPRPAAPPAQRPPAPAPQPQPRPVYTGKLARVITVTSGKGGVGKTTLTANLSAALASLDKKVVNIDADIGLRNLDLIMGLENRIVYDLIDVVEGRCKLRQAMVKHKQYPNLYLIPAAQTRDKTAINPDQMIKIVEELKPEFDFIFIDSPAGIEQGFQNAIAPADEALIVTNPEVSSVRDADRIIGIIESKERKIPTHLVINRVKSEMVRRGEMLSADDVVEILSIKLIGIVPEDETVLVAGNTGNPGTAARATIAFRNIARRLLGEQVPFMDLDEQPGFFQRLIRLFGTPNNSAGG